MNLFWACCISGVREATRGKCWSAAQLSTQVFGSYYLVHFQFSGSHLPGFFWPSLFCHLSANRQPLSCPWCFPLAPAHRMWERHFRLRGTRSGTQCAGAPVRSGWSARRGGAWGRVGARGGACLWATFSRILFTTMRMFSSHVILQATSFPTGSQRAFPRAS